MDVRWPEVDRIELVRGIVSDVLSASDPRGAVTRMADSLGDDPAPIALLAVGKAAVAMASAFMGECGSRVSRGLVVTTEHPEASTLARDWAGTLDVLVGDHPLATGRNVVCAQRVQRFVSAPEGAAQRMVVLLSGGGSALLTLPAEGIELAELVLVTGALMRAGCPIGELNCVRICCERLKGGRLAALSSAMRLSVYALSDVIGDPLSVIASGPFWFVPSAFGDALNILEKYGCLHVSGFITAFLRARVAEDHHLAHRSGPVVEHRVLLGNRDAVEGARGALQREGFVPVVLGAHTGEARDGARELVRGMGEHSAVVMGGEPVVSGIGEGAVGGPVQEGVLAAALMLEEESSEWMVVGLTTDGRDGPTDAAGAAVDRGMLQRARGRGVDLEGALQRHDTHGVLREMGALIVTGATGTNVNDVLVGVRGMQGRREER